MIEQYSITLYNHLQFLDALRAIRWNIPEEIRGTTQGVNLGLSNFECHLRVGVITTNLCVDEGRAINNDMQRTTV
jgi:hypothetical protein